MQVLKILQLQSRLLPITHFVCSAYELAIKIIHASGEDYSNEILEIIKVNQRDAYAVALLCMVLGFYDNGETEKVLWDYYHYFKEHFRGETYSDGPLLGLEEIRAEESGMSELNAQTVS